MGTTTSPQQQNPQAGADKDPCEVLFSMLYPRLFTTNRMYFMTCSFVIPQFTTHVCRAKCKTNPSSIISFERQSRTLLQRVFFKGYLYNVMRYFNFASCFF